MARLGLARRARARTYAGAPALTPVCISPLNACMCMHMHARPSARTCALTRMHAHAPAGRPAGASDAEWCASEARAARARDAAEMRALFESAAFQAAVEETFALVDEDGSQAVDKREFFRAFQIMVEKVRLGALQRSREGEGEGARGMQARVHALD